MNLRNQFFQILTIAAIMLTALSGPMAAGEPRITAEGTLIPGSLRVGEFAVLQVSIRIPDGFHLYSLTRIKAGPMPLTIAPDAPWLTPESFWFGPKPRTVFDDAFEKNVEYHDGTAVFQRVFRLSDAPVGDAVFSIRIRGQICDETTCHTQNITVQIQTAIQPGAPRQQHLQPPGTSGESYPEDRVPGPADPVPTPDLTATGPDRPDAMPLLAFLLMAVIAGFGALLTPCVFPMIPITVSYFSKYERISTRRNLLMAAIYTLSIIVVFSLVGVFMTLLLGAHSMQMVSTHPAFNVLTTLLLVLFALSLFGLFELRLPGFLVGGISAKEETLSSSPDGNLLRQALGVFLMAVTFTLVSFTCTVGFVGWVLALAARGETFYPLVGMMAFAAAFALPFFFLALFPGIATRLQGKGGDWMIAVKVVFGIVELAAAFKFLSNLDLYYGWELLPRPVVLVAWTVLFLCASLYLARIIPFQKKNAQRSPVGPARLFFAMLFAAITALTAFGATHDRPLGGWVDSWLPPVPYPSQTTDSSLTIESAHLPFIRDDIPGAMKRAAAERRPLFIDFTGYQCTNCRLMESAWFPRPAVRSRLERMVRVAAYTDGAADIHRQQNNYKLERFHTTALPFYAIINPATDTVLATFTGMATNEADFLRFLDQGLDSFYK